MIRQIRCECGFVARGQTDDAVVALTLAHVADAHPDLAAHETPDDVRAWIELVEG